ncbi:MAG TPA: TadE/TadG family type IV pilus assembly protein [Isosphaeraceae bacterium]|nr:TadE/TadG family type IV pilus assembly protein [Isosphaeraceae bacterium]
MPVGSRRVPRDPRRSRRGLAAVELAVLLPLLVFACMAAIDFARVAFALVTLQNCARNGALYELYKAAGMSLPSGWTSLSTAVQADAGNLTVTLPSTADGNANPYSPQASSNNYVTVTVQCNFTLLTLGAERGLPSIGGTLTLTQTVSMPYPASTATVP